MTCRITIENTSESNHSVVVNVAETDSPRHEGKSVERHDLAVGEKVTVTIWGWQRYVNVLESDDGGAKHAVDPSVLTGNDSITTPTPAGVKL
jgi:hypothetical protein